jgi:hypothetical protein
MSNKAIQVTLNPWDIRDLKRIARVERRELEQQAAVMIEQAIEAELIRRGWKDPPKQDPEAK